jgi:hypothetical protein
MYYIKRFILRKLFKIMRKTPLDMPMVKYWKKADSVLAKVTKGKDGSLVMFMEGEDYEFPGFPRSHLLYGPLSKLKHEIKNQLFNDNWWKLEDGKSHKEVINDFKGTLPNIFAIMETLKYDMIPPEKMPRGVRELWRAMTILEQRHNSRIIQQLKEVLTFILSEDDAYRMRVQWIVQIFNPSAWWFKLFFRNPIKDFGIALRELENAEVVSDMKEKIRLLRRILLLILEDKKINQLFNELCREMDWSKLKLSEADKYHFRAKYFKVDMDKFEY